MKISIILSHPDKGSFNHALAVKVQDELTRAGHDVTFHDLYDEGFDPVLPAGEIPSDGKVTPPVAGHCEEIAAADGIVIVHPNWWGQPPAILKGWVDRVMRPGVAYRFLEDDSGEGVPEGMLKAKRALVINTSNTPPERERDVFGDPLELIWRDCIFGLCADLEFHRRMFGVIVTSTPEERAGWLEEAGRLARDIFGQVG